MNKTGDQKIGAVHEPELARGLQQVSIRAAEELILRRKSGTEESFPGNEPYIPVIIFIYLTSLPLALPLVIRLRKTLTGTRLYDKITIADF